MLSRYSYYFVLGLGLLFLSSCLGKKKIIETDDYVSEMNAASALKSIVDQSINFETFSANANLNIDSPAFSGSASSKFRIVKDSVIWISVSKFGFEAGRALITKDSVFAMERIQKTYIKTSISELSEKAGLELSYSFIEDFLIGNPYLDQIDNQVSFTDSDSLHVMPNLGEYLIDHIFLSSDYKLRKTTIADNKNDVTAELSYDDYKALDAEQFFSYLRDIIIDSKLEPPTSVSINFSNPEINVEKAIKFSIPDSYSPRSF